MKDLNELTIKDDLLDRNDQFLVGLRSIIKNKDSITDNDSLTLAIDSGWGTGKTWLMHMFIDGIRSDGYIPIYYNAWENDDWNNALIPIVAKINEISSDLKETEKNIIKNINDKSHKVSIFFKNNWKNLIFNFISQSIENITNYNINEIKEIWDKEANKYNLTEEYKSFIEAKNDFKKELERLGKQKKVIFIIDEMDRCRPTYALETLEVVKHFFNIENFIFIFALDMMQLSHSVSNIYGQKMDSTGYLRRFFDMQLKIPSPSIKLYLDHKIKEDIIPKELIDIYKIDEIKSNICILFERLNLSLRDINIIYNNFILFLNYYQIFKLENAMAKFYIYLFLISIKYKNPIMYDIILHKSNLSKEEESFINNYSFLKDISNFIQKFRNRMQMEIDNIPVDSRNTQHYFKIMELTPKKEHEKVFQYIERHLEIILIADDF